MGSRARLQQVLDGADPIAVVNRGVPDDYRTVRLGELAQSRTVRDDDFKLPARGEPHHGLLLDIRSKLGVHQLRSGIGSFTRQIEAHERWIDDPSTKPGVELAPQDDVERWRVEKWPQDVARLKAQRAIYAAVLKEKEDGFGSSGP